ncbi:MAG: tetratricopeptide repeat protein [Betaproteobacteria bacterium]|nr:tetratricopeptide repeat protein [Betaproteobacteria bacterium]
MKKHFTLAFLFNLLIINNSYAISPDAADCNIAFERGDLQKAIAKSANALSVDGKDRDALMCRGRIHGVQKNLAAALADLTAADALSSHPFDKAVIALLSSHAYKASQQYEQAIASYQQTITLAQVAKHKGFERLSNLAIGDIRFNDKQYDQALDHYLKANLLDANDNERADSFERIALAYHKKGQHDAAIENGVKAFLMREKSGSLDQYAQTSIQLGRYYVAAKDYVKAESTLNRIIKFAKERGGAYYEAQGSYVMAQVKAATGDKASAKTLIEHAKSIATNSRDSELATEIETETRDLLDR